MRPAVFTAVFATVFAAALSATHVTPAAAQDEMATSRPAFGDIFSVETIATSVVQSLLSSARLFADIRYDQISVDPVAMRVTLVGLTAEPLIGGAPRGACVIRADRVVLASRALDRPAEARLGLTLDNAALPAGCLPGDARATLAQLGFDALTAPRLSVELTYDYATGGGTAQITADLDGLAAIDAHAEAAYISYRMDYATEEPVLAVDLAQASVTLDDAGAWEIAQQMVPPDQLQPGTRRAMVGAGLQQALQEANAPGDKALSESQRHFIEAAATLAAGFDTGGRIVLATAITTPSLRIDEAALAAFKPLFDALNPVIDTHDPALERIIPLERLRAALETDEPPADAFELGRALLTGVGAPRNREAGYRLLLPLARDGNTEASILMARSLSPTDPEPAYTHALVAAAADEPGALALLDALEARIDYTALIGSQDNAMSDGPDPALMTSVRTMRRIAHDYYTGVGRSRSYRGAFYWASMAAAGGDHASAALRDEINERMRLRGDEAAWAETASSLENGVLRDWVNHRVPEQLQ